VSTIKVAVIPDPRVKLIMTQASKWVMSKLAQKGRPARRPKGILTMWMRSRGIHTARKNEHV
jgi:hypothetical protein